MRAESFNSFTLNTSHAFLSFVHSLIKEVNGRSIQQSNAYSHVQSSSHIYERAITMWSYLCLKFAMIEIM